MEDGKMTGFAVGKAVAIGAAAFTLTGLAADVTASEVVESYNVFYSRYYAQTSTASPASPYVHAFSARVFLEPGLDLIGASGQVTTPLSGIYSLVPGGGGGTLGHALTYAQESNMFATFPGGVYAFEVTSPALDPTQQSGSLTVTSSPFFPFSIPHFTNYGAMQGLDAAQAFRFEWNSFSTNPSAQASDIFLVIANQGGQVVLDQFIDDAAAPGFEVVAGALEAGSTYTATLYFSSREYLDGAGFGGATPTAYSLVSFDHATVAVFTTAVPEPAMAWMLGAGLALVPLLARRRTVARA